MAVVREDVVKIGFDVETDELGKLGKDLDGLKKKLTGMDTDEPFEEMKDGSKKARSSIDTLKDSVNKLGTALGRTAIQAGKLLGKGILAGAAGVGAMVTKSVMGYADYEQLVGGVDTLFKDSSAKVQQYADNAYKTAGISANEYMSTVTSFSASLISSLGGDTGKAADYANRALTDMADNANKMGSDMESIMGTYQSLARGNFGMLDNLKLGYGGTKEEMERLIKDSAKMTDIQKEMGITVDANSTSFSNIVNAISVMQKSMGITGTTAAEASETISGSLASMKAAWGNTLTSLVLGGDDFDRCIDNLVDSAKTFGKNIMPAITKALGGVGDLITELAPLIEKEIPVLVETLLPPLIKAATALVKGIIIALPDIISTLLKEIPGILKEIGSAIGEAFGDLPGMGKVKNFFGGLTDFFTENADKFKKIIPAVGALIFGFKLFGKLKGLGSLFGNGGSGGGSGGGGLLNAKTMLKGLGSIAIALGGLTLVVAAYGGLTQISGFNDFMADGGKTLGQLVDIIADVGLVGGAFVGFTAIVGKTTTITQAATGIADIAIALGGMEALVVAFGALSQIPGFNNLMSAGGSTLKKLVGIIKDLGAIGGAIVLATGLIGFIPSAVFATGLGNIAIALGGMEAVVVAFGALANVPGLDKFMSDGGKLLGELCGIIGNMAGEIIGGIAEGASNALPAIGTNLSTFAENLKPMFAAFEGVDAAGLGEFAGSLAALIAVLTGEQLLSAITGGIDYAGLGTNLSDMATNLSGFFDKVTDFSDDGFKKATALFKCLAGIEGVPKDGGVVGWFEGEVDYGKIADGLGKLAGAAPHFTALKDIPEAAFTKAGQFFNALAGVKALPKGGGFFQMFTGTVDYDSVASGIEKLSSDKMKAALTRLQSFPSFAKLTALLNAFAGVKGLPKSGGVFQWFTGDSTTTLTTVAQQLPGIATHIANFFSNLGGITDFSPIKELFNTLGGIEITSDAADKGFLSLGQSKMEEMGAGLSAFASKAKEFFDAIASLDVAKLGTFYAFLTQGGNVNAEGLVKVSEALSTMADNMYMFVYQTGRLNPENLTAFTGFLQSLEAVPESVSGMADAFSAGIDAMVTKLASGFAKMQADIILAKGNMVLQINTLAALFQTAGVNAANGLCRGMISKLPLLINTARSMARAISSAFDLELDINSPSRVMERKGEFTGLGFNLGLENTIPQIGSTASRVASAAVPGGYSPESSTTYNNGGNSEYTSIAPVFNLTISGSTDDRALARKVKRYINEAIRETFDSMERKSYVVREM